MITLSRNTPVALVVGAAGFIGSHLTEKLLEKSVQIIGVDNLSTGQKIYLEESIKDKNFYLIHQSIAENFDLDLPRLDYAFFVISENSYQNDYRSALTNFLKICSKFQPKIIFVSSIDLYDKKSEGLANIREAEGFLARHSSENKSNIRIVRLGEIYGPRMHFRGNDPIIRLLKSAALDKIQSDDAPLDFTTRAIFIHDAVNLLIKALMHGATAQKIYDGVLLNPVKVAEIKQILLDPLWHENRNFVPTELPPWPTPNIIKTEKELAWKPNTNIVSALRQTLHFLKENTEMIEKESQPQPKVGHPLDEEKPQSKASHPLDEKKPVEIKTFKKKGGHKIKKYLIAGFGLALIIYALFYPMIYFSWQVLDTKNYLQGALNQVRAGNIIQAEEQIKQAEDNAQFFKKWVKYLQSLGSIGLFQSQIQFSEDSLDIIFQGTKAVGFWIEGIKNLEESMQILAGGKEGNLNEVYAQANSNFAQAEATLSFINIKLSEPKYKNNIPDLLSKNTDDLQKRVEYYQELIEQSKTLGRILPAIFASSAPKSYLIVLVDNNNLRAGGGEPKAVAEINLYKGKLKEIKVESVESLDKKLKENIEIPVNLKKDLPLGYWKMGETNFEVDYPANAKLFQWFYQKEQGINTAGVLTLDLVGLNEILTAVGPISLSDKKQISSDNFLALSQGASNQFFEQVLKQVLNKIFFLSSQNYYTLAGSLNKVFEKKHALIYMSDPLFFSQLNSLNLTGVMPRQKSSKVGEKDGFLAFFETNLGNKGSFDLTKNINLQSTISDSEEITHKLQINFTNQEGVINAKFKEQIFLPAGTKLNKASFAGKDIIKDVSSYSDFGRAVYSMVLEISSKEEKTLVLEYQDNKKLEFDAGVATINMEVIKQPGEQDNNFTYKLIYPQNFFLVSPVIEQNIPQEVTFSTTLSTDKNFQIILKK